MLGPWHWACRRVQQALSPPSPAYSISSVLDFLLCLCLILLCSPPWSGPAASKLIPVDHTGSLEPTWTPQSPTQKPQAICVLVGAPETPVPC